MVLSKGQVLAELPVTLDRPRRWEALVDHADFKAQVAKVLGLVRSA